MLEEIFERASLKDILLVFLAATAVIGFWRGIWNLLDQFFLVNNFVLSQVVSIVVGILILVLLSKYGDWKKKK